MATPRSSQPQRVTALPGRVVRGAYGKGSKSEREAVFLETSATRYILRRKTGPAIGDKELTQYVGHQVVCDGFVLGTTFLAERIEIVT
jgi:hypothetical protein